MNYTLVSVLFFLFTTHYTVAQHYQLPNPTLTPGVVNGVVIADTTGKQHLVGGVEINICAVDFRTKPFRKTSSSLKSEVCSEYDAKPGTCPSMLHGEVDHLIPLEIGGQDTLRNLWWQPAPEYKVKDHYVEDLLPKLICTSKITLPEAQKCIASNWVTCMKKVKSLEGSSK